MYTEHFNGTTTGIQLRYLKVWVDILYIRYWNTEYGIRNTYITQKKKIMSIKLHYMYVYIYI
jgi:hypothetical protein